MFSEAETIRLNSRLNKLHCWMTACVWMDEHE